MAKAGKNPNGTAANLGYEAQLWQMTDALESQLISGVLRIEDPERFPDAIAGGIWEKPSSE